MAAKRTSRTLFGVKVTKGDVSEDDWSVIHRFTVALEKGRFNEYIELLQNTKQLLWKSFLNGLAKGFGAVVGATVVVALVVALLSVLASTDILPDDIQEFFKSTKGTIEQPAK